MPRSGRLSGSRLRVREYEDLSREIFRSMPSSSARERSTSVRPAPILLTRRAFGQVTSPLPATKSPQPCSNISTDLGPCKPLTRPISLFRAMSCLRNRMVPSSSFTFSASITTRKSSFSRPEHTSARSFAGTNRSHARGFARRFPRVVADRFENAVIGELTFSGSIPCVRTASQSMSRGDLELLASV